MRRRLLVGAVGALALSCGGGEDPPDCPTDDCSIPGRTVLSWTFNRHPEFGFPNDTCQDLGVATLHAEAIGVDDPTQVQTKDVPCGQGQVSFLKLPPGNYRVSLTPLGTDGTSLVKAPVSTEMLAGSPGADTSATLNVPYDAWTTAYTGTFLFRISWGGMSCELATPPVATQTLTLMAGGQVVTAAVTDKGQKLDGTDPKPCRPLTESFPQFAPEDPQNQRGLPFGPATLVVVGKDAAGEIRFEQAFDTFVGAAKNNPTLTFDVVPPDAGVDAGVDAAVDASVDAM